ncbi:MAG: class I SAM-dependent DNA methyltransferase [Pirellulales bacterium]|nr:class I SAM-dependent DNA methyltransferase [Pirellulales bacterium]
MPISWNEIRSRAITFSREWTGVARERAEAQTFWNEFFKVFGLTRRHVASFEEPVRGLSGSYGFIDLFWKGILLAEHKSRDKDLDKAHCQAMDYIQDLQRENRADEVPRYVIVSDFAQLALHDLEEDVTVQFPLAEFHRHISHFGFIPGYKQHKIEDEDPINIRAVRIMGDLHDALEAGGYSGHELERMLVRALFCLFADDTGIFERDAFKLFIENHTKADGSDLGPQLALFFQVLNTPKERRQKNLLEELAELPYVNGELFAESLRFAAFNSDMRNRLIACSRFDWSRISPAIFGALFQAVMESKERRQIGAHYTSERDILKVIGPLFLDELRAELDKAKHDRRKLRALHERLASIRLLDPACGCGNFLVVSYRELRKLELEILKRLEHGRGDTQKMLDVGALVKIDVDQMYGIEIEEWPARIAEVAMWLMDHQMNLLLSETFGQYFARLPLLKSPHIHHGNALRIDWNDLLPADRCTHVLGNPPFVGKRYRTTSQSADHTALWSSVRGSAKLDYVTCWYLKACQYIQNTNITSAFVSTNSITQGEQVPILWPELFEKYGLKIHFAHRTFQWESEARGRAHVHVVIIGFGTRDVAQKTIYEYENGRGDSTSVPASNIAPYLIDGSDLVVKAREKTICDAPQIVYGSMANDGGYLVLDAEQRREILRQAPQVKRYLRPFLGSVEFINSMPRWCLWLVDADPTTIRKIPALVTRIRKVKAHRSNSTRDTTRELAATPTVFGEIRQPDVNYLLIPKNPSQRRRYLTVGFMPPSVIASDQCLIIPGAGLYEFGVISSAMHIAWLAAIGGRLKSDYRYSNTIVYNNYPWPQDVADAKRRAVEEAAQRVLDVREAHPDASLADLYDPLSMPVDLAKAHAKLDRAVDRCYRAQPFANERNRVEYLFRLYEQLTSPLLPAKPARKKKR